MTTNENHPWLEGQHLPVQLISYLTHESRNALQRGQAALEQLRWRLAEQPDLLQMVTKAQGAHEELLRLYEAAREYMTPIQLNCNLNCLAEIWWEVWSRTTAAHALKKVKLQENLKEIDLRCEADRFQLAQAFRHLLENSLETCPDPACITLSAQDLREQAAIQLTLRDNGPDPDPLGREYFFDPFHFTRPRKNKLGMAVARNIIEAHQGRLFLGEGPGFTLVLQLPRRRS